MLGNQVWATFALLPAHPGSPGQRAVKRACVSLLCSASYAEERLDTGRAGSGSCRQLMPSLVSETSLLAPLDACDGRSSVGSSGNPGISGR